MREIPFHDTLAPDSSYSLWTDGHKGLSILPWERTEHIAFGPSMRIVTVPESVVVQCVSQGVRGHN